MRDENLDTMPSPGQDEVTQPESGERQCLSNDEVLAFAQGRLTEAELARLHAHVDHCATCQRLKGQRHRLKDWARRNLIPPGLPPLDRHRRRGGGG